MSQVSYCCSTPRYPCQELNLADDLRRVAPEIRQDRGVVSALSGEPQPMGEGADDGHVVSPPGIEPGQHASQTCA